MTPRKKAKNVAAIFKAAILKQQAGKKKLFSKTSLISEIKILNAKIKVRESKSEQAWRYEPPPPEAIFKPSTHYGVLDNQPIGPQDREK